eukprot:jgi/Botrbrau1/17209/Bobra.0817s0005.1
MDIAGAVSFLKLRKQAAENILSKLTAAISELPELDSEEATNRVQLESNASIDFAINELEAWKSFLDEGGLPSPAAADAALATPVVVSRRRTIQEKLAAMGGVPALGGMALPMATVAQRKSLIVTESPASQEMTRNHFVRLSSTNSAAAQQIAQLSKAQATEGRSDSTSLDSAAGSEPAWKVQLRPAANASAEPAPLDLQSELAAKLARFKRAAEGGDT